MSKDCGNILYKCRRCGETFKDTHSPNILLSLIFSIQNVNTAEFYVPMFNLHNCSDGELGVSDLIGAEHDK